MTSWNGNELGKSLGMKKLFNSNGLRLRLVCLLKMAAMLGRDQIEVAGSIDLGRWERTDHQKT